MGHSAHVTNVRWSHDSTRLVSTGGADTAVLVWRREALGGTRKGQGDSDDSDTDEEEEGKVIFFDNCHMDQGWEVFERSELSELYLIFLTATFILLCYLS